MVFFAGLPGTGKSRSLQRLAHLAHADGRTVHLLQWDVARPVFEASPAARRYPARDGVTHPLIRKAAGVWARSAVTRWARRRPGSKHLLLGEAPLVGHRFLELARREDDAAERLLTLPSCRFVIPVPSVEVRRVIEAERQRRTGAQLHDREREDALPHVLRSLWEDLVTAARRLEMEASGEQASQVPYDPALYERVYRHVLTHRRVTVLAVETVAPDAAVSVHAFGIPVHEVVPAPEEAWRFIHAVERTYHDADTLQEEVDRWYVV